MEYPPKQATTHTHTVRNNPARFIIMYYTLLLPSTAAEAPQHICIGGVNYFFQTVSRPVRGVASAHIFTTVQH